MNIYIAGEAGSGKSSVSGYFVKNEGYMLAKLAYPIYDIAENYFGMTVKDRRLLQFLGTDSGRILNSDIWINRLLEDIEIIKRTYRILYGKTDIRFINDDTRFSNESYLFKENGWKGFYLKASKELRRYRLIKRDGNVPKGFDEHESETSLELFKNSLIQIDASKPLNEVVKQIKENL